MKLKLIAIALFLVSLSFGQRKEKIKGSKIVTVQIKETENFDGIDIADNIEVFLVKADKSSVEIEADDNLHDVIVFDILAGTLKISTTKEVIRANKFSLRINYTDSLKTIVVKDKAKLNALSDLELNDITIKNFDDSKSFLNVKSPKFTIQLNDKSEAELNIKSENTILEISKNARAKALVTSTDFKLDMYQKSDLDIEGETVNAQIRLDNNADLNAKKFSVSQMNLTTEAYTSCAVNVKDNLKISATGKSKVELLGDAKIEIIDFKNNAILEKIEK
ncbi:GIN domain-containing protein [Flavobacterium sp.]|uniref:GIN domain-containing protein n=1 Tax=Flavobacterium sp. TaxID=239 RepID=UPI003F6A0A71